MWARRCGAGPQWPSRIKVLIQSFASAAVGLAVFNYMASADLGYLNLKQPHSDVVLCLEADAWPVRHSLRSWFDAKSWGEWKLLRTKSADDYVREYQCRGVTNYTNVKCRDVYIPLEELDRNLAVVLGNTGSWSEKLRNDAVEAYGYLFFYFSVALWVIVTFHDMALLSERYRNSIYDFRAIRNRFSCCACFLYAVSAFRLFKRLLRGGGFKLGRRRCCVGLGRVLGWLLAPVFAAWIIVAYNIIIMPVVTVFFLIYPVRLSRIVLFLTCLTVGTYGVVLTIHMIVWMAKPDIRQQYAVTWEATWTSTAGVEDCVCGCLYPVKGDVCATLCLIGVSTAYRAFALAFRCLKGLRRASWASLMSVLFPVPLNVYEAYWTQPDGGPIRHRVQDQPVQGELAFDAFALMDEQPESAWTSVQLMPASLLKDYEPSSWSVEDVVKYFKALHLKRYCRSVRKHGLDGPTLLQLLRLDGLDELGIASQDHANKIRIRLGTWSCRKGFSGANDMRSDQSFANNRNQIRECASPKITKLQEMPEEYADREFIGCCGFPRLAGEDSRREYRGVIGSDSEGDFDPDPEDLSDAFTLQALWIPTERLPIQAQLEFDLDSATCN